MDIIEKLRATEMRETGQELGGIPITKLTQINPDGPEAADEIERLREVLECVVKYWDEWKSAPDDHLTELSIAALSLEEVVNMARSALKEKE